MKKEFWKYVIPSVLAFALSGVYAIVDGFFVGRSIGDMGLAAINIAYPLTALLQAAGTGLGMGGAVHMSIHMGAGEEGALKRYFTCSIALLLLTGGVLTGLFLLLAPTVLVAFGASGDILPLAAEYIRFITFGALFQVLGTGLVPLLRNLGEAVHATVAMAAGFIANILLDYLLVWVYPFGMMGAAIATVLGQAATLLLCALFLMRKKGLLTAVRGREARSTVSAILRVGASPFGLAYAPQITLILMNKSAIAYGGAAAVACYSVISYLTCVVALLLQGVGDGSQPLLSRCFGRRDTASLRQVQRMTYGCSIALSAVCAAALWLLRGVLPALFGASHAVAVQIAEALPLFILGFFFLGFSRATTSYFYATQQNGRAYGMIFGEPVLLLLLLLTLPRAAGLTGVWLAVPIAQLIVAGFGVLLYLRRPPALCCA